MWRSVFSFRGEVTRRGFALRVGAYLGAYFAAGILLFTPTYFAAAKLAASGQIPPSLFGYIHKAAVPVTLVICTVPYFWALAALAAKRARNAGLSPLIAAAWFLAGPATALVLANLRLEGGPRETIQLLASIAFFGVWIVLLAWPPKAGPGSSMMRQISVTDLDRPARQTFGMRG